MRFIVMSEGGYQNEQRGLSKQEKGSIIMSKEVYPNHIKIVLFKAFLPSIHVDHRTLYQVS